MTTVETEQVEDEVIESDEESEEVETEDGAEVEEAPEGPEELEITIGEDRPEPVEAAPSWVKELRQRNRELAKRNRELEEQSKTKPAAVERQDIGKEPELGDADIDYDADKFKSKWREWNEKKQAQDAKQREAQDRERKLQEDWQKTVDTYKSESKALRVPDFEEAEGAWQEAFSVVQQGIILQGVEKRAQLVYALGKNPKRLAELAAIQDPVKFAVKIGELAAQMKVTTRKPATKPETTVKGGSVPGAAGGGNARLDALRDKCLKTGDMTEYHTALRAAKKK